jgi:hypothetical protein
MTCHAIYWQKARTKSKDIGGSDHLIGGRVFQKVKKTELHTLPVLHFNCRLTTKYSEAAAHLNGNFDTDNQIFVP